MAHVILSSVTTSLANQFQDPKAMLVLLVVGMVAGLLSQMILPGRGFGMVTTIIVGLIGAWAGNQYIKAFITFIDNNIVKEIIAATVGAMVLSLVINLIRGGKDNDKTQWRHN